MGLLVNALLRPLYPRKDSVRIVREAGLAAGPVWMGAEYLTPTAIQSPDRPACSRSLYQLSYPGGLTHSTVSSKG